MNDAKRRRPRAVLVILLALLLAPVGALLGGAAAGLAFRVVMADSLNGGGEGGALGRSLMALQWMSVGAIIGGAAVLVATPLIAYCWPLSGRAAEQAEPTMASEPMRAPHRNSPRNYFVVFAALLLLTASTVAASYIDLGAWHTTVGMLIAAAKATLILLIFMHGLESGRLVWMVIAVSILFLAILFAFTFADYTTRRIDDGVRDPGARSELAGPALGLR